MDRCNGLRLKVYGAGHISKKRKHGRTVMQQVAILSGSHLSRFDSYCFRSRVSWEGDAYLHEVYAVVRIRWVATTYNSLCAPHPRYMSLVRCFGYIEYLQGILDVLCKSQGVRVVGRVVIPVVCKTTASAPLVQI